MERKNYKKTLMLIAGASSVALPFVGTASAIAAVPPNVTAVKEKTAYVAAQVNYKAKVKAETLAKAAVVRAKKTPSKADDVVANAALARAHKATVAALTNLNRTKAAWLVARTKVTGTFLGDLKSTNPYGGTRVQIVVNKGKITSVTYPVYPTTHEESKIINDFFMPTMVSEALKAQSANIALVSGASLTFPDFKASLQSALTKTGL